MIFKSWYKFWFQEQSPLPLALFRIFFGFFVVQMSLLELLPNLAPFLAPGAWFIQAPYVQPGGKTILSSIFFC